MEPILKSKPCSRASLTLSSAVLCVLSCACGAVASSSVPAAAAHDVDAKSPPRRPDGVLLDEPAALPASSDRAAARGVVSLREPLAIDAIKDIAHAYVRSFAREDESAFNQLLFAPDVAPLYTTRVGRQTLSEQFRTRIKNYDYAKLGTSEIARLDQIERYAIDELGLPGTPDRPSEMKPGDLLIRIPIATPRIGAEPLFGDVVVLLLRRDEGRFKIAGAAEENGP